jgi:uncharacterized DUF497 family protein
VARDRVSQLVTSDLALDKLGGRGISAHEAEQIPQNLHATVPNPRAPQGASQRLLLIGRTGGGRILTLVIERTVDPTTWLVVTGWHATDRERTILERHE